MSEKIEIALLGGSNQSAVGRAHVAALRLSGLFDLKSGFMSRNSEVNSKSGSEYGIKPNAIFDDFDSFLNNAIQEKLTVLVCTPTNQHAEQVMSCLRHGLNVICEKALSDNHKDLLNIKNLSESTGSNLYVIYNYTSYPAIRKIKSMVESNKLGKILKLNMQMPQEGYLRKDFSGLPIIPQSWRLHDGEVPTISLDLGVHLHSLSKFILQKRAKSLVAVESSNGNFPGIIDDVKCIANYEDNIEIFYWYSKSALGSRNGLRIEIFGSDGSISWEQNYPEEIVISMSDGTKILMDRGSPDNQIANEAKYNYFKPGHPTGFIEALSNYYVDIHAAFTQQNPIDQKTRLIFGVEEAIEGFEFLQAIHNSSRNNGWVFL